jgi:hypothetical protein
VSQTKRSLRLSSDRSTEQVGPRLRELAGFAIVFGTLALATWLGMRVPLWLTPLLFAAAATPVLVAEQKGNWVKRATVGVAKAIGLAVILSGILLLVVLIGGLVGWEGETLHSPSSLWKH